MDRQRILIFLVLAGLVTGVGLFLNRLHAGHRLGDPGLRIVEQKVFDTDTNVVCTNTIALPETVLNYKSVPLQVAREETNWLPKDTTFGRRRYTARDRFWMDISVVLMGKDRTSIHRPQICLTGQGWVINQSEAVSVPISKPTSYSLPVLKLTASKVLKTPQGTSEPFRAIYAYWFVSDRRITADHWQRLWWMATDVLKTGVLPRWAYISYFAICKPGEEDATFERMKKFIAASVPEYQLVTGVTSAQSGPARLTVQK